MRHVIFDCETIPNRNLPESLIPTFSNKTLKDPKKIEVAKEKFKLDLVKKMSIDTNLAEIVCIGYIVIDDNEKVSERGVLMGDTDKEILEKFFKVIQTDDTLIGHNSKQFDIPLIYKRSLINNVGGEYYHMLRKGMKKYDRYSIDIEMEWDINKMTSLNKMAQLLGVGVKSGDGSEVYGLYNSGKKKELGDYCMQDVQLTYEIFKRMF